MPDYPGYVPGPSMATVPFALSPIYHGGDDVVRQISALAGLPQFTPLVSQVAIPGTVGAFATIVLGVGGRVG